MQIMNLTKNALLAENTTIADTLFKRIKGLLGRKDFNKGEALIIKPCNSIHTFFMRFPIDVVFVDAKKRVVKTISNMRPFRISGICLKARFSVELPAGSLQKTATQTGDTLHF